MHACMLGAVEVQHPVFFHCHQLLFYISGSPVITLLAVSQLQVCICKICRALTDRSE